MPTPAPIGGARRAGRQKGSRVKAGGPTPLTISSAIHGRSRAASSPGDLLLEFHRHAQRDLRLGDEHPLSNTVQTMVYESLLNLHPTTLNYAPGARHPLASLPATRLTYTASGSTRMPRFQDGQPVVADDVVSQSWTFSHGQVAPGEAKPSGTMLRASSKSPVAGEQVNRSRQEHGTQVGSISITSRVLFRSCPPTRSMDLTGPGM